MRTKCIVSKYVLTFNCLKRISSSRVAPNTEKYEKISVLFIFHIVHLNCLLIARSCLIAESSYALIIKQNAN